MTSENINLAILTEGVLSEGNITLIEVYLKFTSIRNFDKMFQLY
jgi:hypothetical protein